MAEVQKYSCPQKVDIGGITYSIKLKDTYSVHCGAEPHVGFHNRMTGEILLSTQDSNGDNQCLDYINSSLWHEMVHGISCGWQLEFDEKVTESVANAIHSILKDLGIYLIKEE